MGTHGAIFFSDVLQHANIVTKPNDIIASPLFVMETFNAALTTVAYGGKVNVNTKITAAANNMFTF